MKQKLSSEFDRERVIGIIRRLDLSQPYTVEIRQRKARRSLDQNALYWLWLTCISHETGNGKDELHEYFKIKFLPSHIIEVCGEKIEMRTSKTDKSTFRQYLDLIQVFASSELAITLPNPEDRIWDEFYEYYRDRL